MGSTIAQPSSKVLRIVFTAMRMRGGDARCGIFGSGMGITAMEVCILVCSTVEVRLDVRPPPL